MLRYQVKFLDGWAPVDTGIVLADGRLAWWKGEFRGIAQTTFWMLTEYTRNHPVFKAACWEALSAEEKKAALERRAA
jgi:hypothetical protein